MARYSESAGLLLQPLPAVWLILLHRAKEEDPAAWACAANSGEQLLRKIKGIRSMVFLRRFLGWDFWEHPPVVKYSFSTAPTASSLPARY